MPSPIHEALHHALRGDPDLIGSALRHAAGVNLNVLAAEEITHDATCIQVTERRCDTVMRLEIEGHGTAVLLVESQTKRDQDKETVWPQVVAHFQDKYDCPVILLVITQHETTAAWARGPFFRSFAGLRASLVLHPAVAGPVTVPPITDPSQARTDIPGVVLSALVNGSSQKAPDILEALRDALDTVGEEEKVARYAGLVQASLQNNPTALALWEEIMSTSTQRFVSTAEARGEARGEINALLLMLRTRDIAVTDEARERITGCEDRQQIETWIVRAQSIKDIDELFD